MADEVTPQKVTPTVNWASLSQTIFLGLIAALQGANSYQLSGIPKSGDPNIPPAPAPVITAATLHDDLLRIEKKVDQAMEELNPTQKK